MKLSKTRIVVVGENCFFCLCFHCLIQSISEFETVWEGKKPQALKLVKILRLLQEDLRLFCSLHSFVKVVNFRGFLGTTAVNAKSKVKLCISRSFARLLQKGKRKRTPEPTRELRTAFLKQ